MFCNKCGAQLPDDAKFCNKCGVSFADRAPRESQTAKPSPSADAVSAAATLVGSPTHPNRNKKPIVIGIAVVLLVAAVVVAGNLTDWFGHTSKGVWRLTKVYTNDSLTGQFEYDDYGREVSARYDISKDGKSYKSRTSSYNDDGSNRSSCTEVDEKTENGSTKKVGEKQYEYELGPNGRVLSCKMWDSSYSELKEDDEGADSYGVLTCSYNSSGAIVSIEREDPKDGSWRWSYKRSEFDHNGYTTKNIGNSNNRDITYSVSYSSSGKPEAVFTGGSDSCEVKADDNGNIKSATIHGTTYRYEYQFFPNPRKWDVYRPSVYMDW